MRKPSEVSRVDSDHRSRALLYLQEHWFGNFRGNDLLEEPTLLASNGSYLRVDTLMMATKTFLLGSWESVFLGKTSFFGEILSLGGNGCWI
jgi:hypothetical protein